MLIGTVIVSTAVSGYIFLGLADTNDPTPDVVLALDPADDGSGYDLVHEGGETFGGEEIVLRGTADPDALADRRLQAGDRERIQPTAETVEVVWDDGDQSYILTEFDVGVSAAVGCPYVESQITGADNDTLVLDGGKRIGCDVVYDVDIEHADLTIENGTTIVGDVGGDLDEFEIEDASVTGDVDLSQLGAGTSGYEAFENVTIDGDVTVDNATTDQDLQLDDDSIVGGDVTVHGDDATLRTGQNDDIPQIGGSVSVSATGTGSAEADFDRNTTVDGGVDVDGGSAILTGNPRTEIGGTVVLTATDGSATVVLDDDSSLGGADIEADVDVTFDLGEDVRVDGPVEIDAGGVVTVNADAGAEIDGDLIVVGDTVDDGSIDPSQVAGTYDTTET